MILQSTRRHEAQRIKEARSSEKEEQAGSQTGKAHSSCGSELSVHTSQLIGAVSWWDLQTGRREQGHHALQAGECWTGQRWRPGWQRAVRRPPLAILDSRAPGPVGHGGGGGALGLGAGCTLGCWGWQAR